MNCDMCEGPISTQNISGICRPCRCRLNRIGPPNKRRLERLAAANRDPAKIARQLAAYCPVPPLRRKGDGKRA